MRAATAAALLLLLLAPQVRAQSPAERRYDHDALEERKPAAVTEAPEPGNPFLEAGEALYVEHCAPCHGETGAGDGLAADVMYPRPRDFTAGNFGFRTTRSGELPTDADLFRTISRGVPGTAMPAWGEGVFTLGEEERWQLVYYVKHLTGMFWDEWTNPYREPQEGMPPVRVQLGEPPAATDELLARGREMYMGELAGCVRCHGERGRGDGEAAAEQLDDLGRPVRPADLTNPWRIKNGTRPEDYFRTLSTGISGTPMPSFLDSIGDKDRWALALYAQSLIEERSVASGPLTARRVEQVPRSPDHEVWESCDPMGIPLMGQLVAPARWRAPMVDYVRLCAVYDEEAIAIRVEWNDPFENDGTPGPLKAPGAAMTAGGAPAAGGEVPPPAGDAAIAPTDAADAGVAPAPADAGVAPAFVDTGTASPTFVDAGAASPAFVDAGAASPAFVDAGAPAPTFVDAGAPAPVGDAGPPAAAGPAEREGPPSFVTIDAMNARALAEWPPDRLALHLPVGRREPGRIERPHFLMGDPGHPLHAWLWSAEDGGTVGEANARGVETGYEPQPDGAVQVTGHGEWREGRWRVVLRRSLRTGEHGTDAQLRPGGLVPIAIRVWEGGAGESGRQSAVSVWRHVHLEAPIPAEVYTRAGVATLLGYFLVGLAWWRIRR